MERRRKTMHRRGSTLHKIIKVVKIILIIILILALLFVALCFYNDRNGNRWKKKNFTESDYKTISSVFSIDDPFTINELIYCPQTDSGSPWYSKEGSKEVYTVNLFMEDISKLENFYKMVKYDDGSYSSNICKSNQNEDIGLQVQIERGADLNNPDVYRVAFFYHGHNDELNDILPFFSF